MSSTLEKDRPSVVVGKRRRRHTVDKRSMLAYRTAVRFATAPGTLSPFSKLLCLVLSVGILRSTYVYSRVQVSTISLLVGGGCDDRSEYVELLADGVGVARATGICTESMRSVRCVNGFGATSCPSVWLTRSPPPQERISHTARLVPYTC